jgi:tRNA threonylcarbamoyladenosine biosynthesis protein TsaE
MMKEEMKQSFSAEETYNIGKKLAKECQPGDVILLNGDLGVGKTVFAKGFGEGLHIKEPINSPTFTILQEYDTGKIPFYHFDVYRISDVSEMDEIGYDDYFFGNGICLIEWAERIEEIIPEKRINVIIEKDLKRGFDFRKILIQYVQE